MILFNYFYSKLKKKKKKFFQFSITIIPTKEYYTFCYTLHNKKQLEKINKNNNKIQKQWKLHCAKNL